VHPSKLIGGEAHPRKLIGGEASPSDRRASLGDPLALLIFFLLFPLSSFFLLYNYSDLAALVS